jgi:hypothetical protein
MTRFFSAEGPSKCKYRLINVRLLHRANFVPSPPLKVNQTRRSINRCLLERTRFVPEYDKVTRDVHLVALNYLRVTMDSEQQDGRHEELFRDL